MISCKKCGLPMQWIKSGARWLGQNADGSDHWDACARAYNERVKREGVPFKDSKGEGFVFAGKKKYQHMVAYTDHGKRVKALPDESAEDQYAHVTDQFDSAARESLAVALGKPDAGEA